MNKLIVIGFSGFVWVTTCGWSQEINVTATGVESSSASGSLMQQSGQTTSFVTKVERADESVRKLAIEIIIRSDGGLHFKITV